MKKTLISSVTAFAIVLSAGMALAGPVRDHGQRGHAHDVRSSASQTLSHTNRIENDRITATPTERSIELTSKQSLGPNSLSSAQQKNTYGADWNSNLAFSLEGNTVIGIPRQPSLRGDWQTIKYTAYGILLAH